MKTYAKKGFGTTLVILLVSACGENDSDGGGNTLTPGSSFSALSAEASRLDARAETLPVVLATGILDMGVVTYDGIVSLNPEDGPDLIGNLTLETDFMASEITGGVTNIINEDEEAYTGSLGVSGDIIRSGDTNINASMSGIISNADGDLTTVLTTMTGVFQGFDADMATGTLEGNITGGDYGITGSAVTGTFAAEQ